MKDLGLAKKFLGIAIDMKEGESKLNQGTYATSVVERFKELWSPVYSSAPIVPLPHNAMELAAHLTYGPMDEDDALWSEWFESFPYRSVVGALHLSTNIRPDIAFAVSLLARFGHKPT